MSDGTFFRELSRRQVIQSALVVAGGSAAGLLPGCAPQAAAPAGAPAPPSSSGPKKGGTLITARSDTPASLNPHLEALDSRVRVTVLLYNGLVRMDDNAKIVGDLVGKSWDTPDTTSYVFKLRKGVKFHNGREFVADDVKYSLNRQLDEKNAAPGRTEFTPIKSIDTPDKYTVKITTTEPFAGLLASLAGKYGAIVPEEAVKQYGDLKKNAVGTGPFMLDSWEPGQFIRLKKNPSYFREGLPYLDGIEWRIVPDQANIVAGLRAGTIHVGAIDDRNLAAVLKNETSVTLYSKALLGADSVWMSTKQEPLGNVKVRQAISMAIDREAIIKAAVAGFGVLSGPVPVSQKEYSLPEAELATLYKRDVVKAKQLLAEAGFPNGFKMDLINLAGYPALSAGQQVIAANLKEVGIDATLSTLESGQSIAKFTNWDYPASMNSAGGLLDPDSWFRLVHSQPAGRDWQTLANPEFDSLLERGRTTLDPAKRADIYREFQRKLLAAGGIIILYAPLMLDAASNKVKGFTQIPTGWNYGLESVWIDG